MCMKWYGTKAPEIALENKPLRLLAMQKNTASKKKKVKVCKSGFTLCVTDQAQLSGTCLPGICEEKVK